MSKTTIGVFDSGFGGLTVLRALLPLIPDAHYIYLGDTARLPYGSKSQTTIARYAVESALELERRGAQTIVIACNTATALALPEITAACRVPVIGVIAPGAQAAATALQRNVSSRPDPERAKRVEGAAERPAFPATQSQVLVLATTATVQSHAYREALARHDIAATEKACPLLVPLIEEGWTDSPITRDVLRVYLKEALATCTPQAVLLGCTHYPLIAAQMSATLAELGTHIPVIDSADATAQAVAATVAARTVPRGLSLGSHSSTNRAGASAPTFTCIATDSTEKFATLGSRFLGRPIPHVQLLDLGG